MGMTVIEVDAVADAMLPVGPLVAQMRLADGVTTDPEQLERLRSRLRAAIDLVERRLGRILLARKVTFAGSGPGGRRVSVPTQPVADDVVVTVRRGGSDMAIDVLALERGADGAVVVLASPVRTDEAFRVVLTAGAEAWPDVSAGIAQAILLTAEALDAGEGEALVPMVETLLAPYRVVRIGRAG